VDPVVVDPAVVVPADVPLLLVTPESTSPACCDDWQAETAASSSSHDPIADERTHGGYCFRREPSNASS
jgi:hypothetical protein